MKNKIVFGLLSAVLFTSACQSSSSIPISKSVRQINVAAVPICGAGGTQRSAVKLAAISTLRSNYDSFIVRDTSYSNNVTVVSGTPTSSKTVSTIGVEGDKIVTESHTQDGPSFPTVEGQHHQSMTIKMFSDGERGSENAVDARQVLGANWATIINKKFNSCL